MNQALFGKVEALDEWLHRRHLANRWPFYYLCDWRDRQYGYPGKPGPF